MANEIGREQWGRRSVLIIRCNCGAKLACPNFTNTCEKCQADYNSAGQRLAPREQWGEETQEQLSDILMADTDPWGEDSW